MKAKNHIAIRDTSVHQIFETQYGGRSHVDSIHIYTHDSCTFRHDGCQFLERYCKNWSAKKREVGGQVWVMLCFWLDEDTDRE